MEQSLRSSSSPICFVYLTLAFFSSQLEFMLVMNMFLMDLRVVMSG